MPNPTPAIDPARALEAIKEHIEGADSLIDYVRDALKTPKGVSLRAWARRCEERDREMTERARSYCAELDEIAALIGQVPGLGGKALKPVVDKVKALLEYMRQQIAAEASLAAAVERARLDPDPMHNPVEPRSKLVAEGVARTEVASQPTAYVSDTGRRISLTGYTECAWRGTTLERPIKWQRNPYPGLVAVIAELSSGHVYRYSLFDHGEPIVSGTHYQKDKAELELNRAISAWYAENAGG